MKKNIIIYCIATVCVLSLNSCAELMQIANYTASTWVQTMDTKELSTPENTLHANAWLSGTGGKVMVTGDVLASIIGDVSGKDVSGVQNIIRGSMNNVVSDPNASKNDNINIVGSLFAIGGNTVNHFESKNFAKEEAAFYEKYTDPESLFYDPYCNCRYVIDQEKKFIRPQVDHNELMKCIREVDKAKYESELETILQENYGMSYKEYSEMPITERPSLTAIVSKSAGTIFENNVEFPEQETVQPSVTEDKTVMQAQAAEERKIALEKVATVKINDYAFDETALSAEQETTLDGIAETLKKYSDVQVLITGHTCEIGYKNINLKKGLKRAEAGKEYLIGKGIAAERIVTDSKGEEQSLVPNTSSDNRKQNRRIEFAVK